MDIPKVKIEDTPMQSFLRDEISSYRKCSYLYSDRLQLLSDKSRYLHPIKIQEEEALRHILIAYKKLDTTLISQIEGLTPYYDCNLSNLTNIHADDSQPYKDQIVIMLAMVDQMMDQGREYCKDDNSFNRTIKSNLAHRKKIRDELHYHCNRYEVYKSRYDAFDKKRKSTYGVSEVDVCEVAQTIKDLISLTKRIIDKLVHEFDKEPLWCPMIQSLI